MAPIPQTQPGWLYSFGQLRVRCTALDIYVPIQLPSHIWTQVLSGYLSSPRLRHLSTFFGAEMSELRRWIPFQSSTALGDEGHDYDTSTAFNDEAIHVGWVNPLENAKIVTTASHRPTRSSHLPYRHSFVASKVDVKDPVATDLTSRRGGPTATTDGADQRQQWECGQHRAQDKDLTTIPGHVHRVPTLRAYYSYF